MYVTRTRIPNRDSPPAVLLRESYREGGKVRSRTLANISDWPEAKIDSLRRVLAGETLVPLGAEPFEIARALAHGHVAAVLGTVVLDTSIGRNAVLRVPNADGCSRLADVLELPPVSL